MKNWIWLLSILALLVGAGVYLGNSRRAELGESFSYSVDEYRAVDPALIQYAELDSIPSTVGSLSAVAVAVDGTLVLGGVNGITGVPESGTPSCLAVDDDGVIFAGMNDHVEVFLKAGETAVWSSPGPKAYFTSIAVDDEFVFVADAGSRCVWRYPKAGGEPFRIEGARKFYIPSPYFDLDIGPDGSIWVVNPGYHALENFSADGRLISSWENGSFAIDGFSGCCNPAHFALMPDGSFLTAEKGLPRVKIHNVDGSLRCVVADANQVGEAIADVAVDERGRIYVLCGERVRVFEEKK
jgi:cytochrome c-type biogenesis protein CcmH/NrfF